MLILLSFGLVLALAALISALNGNAKEAAFWSAMQMCVLWVYLMAKG